MVSFAKGCKNLLRALGWNCKEASFRNRDGSMAWQVDAARLGHKISAWGRTQTEAWESACRQARRVYGERYTTG